MKRKEKAEKIVKILENYYPETPIPLDHNSVFQLLIAVLMSAQTTDKKVNQVTPELFEIAPNAKLMSQLDAEKIQSIIREVGLAPTKAKNIKKLSGITNWIKKGFLLTLAFNISCSSSRFFWFSNVILCCGW